VKKGKTVDDVTSARTRTADKGKMQGRGMDDTSTGGSSITSSATMSTRAEAWGDDSKSVRRPSASSSISSIKTSQSVDLQAMAKAREKQREETIVKRHLFGVPPPDDKSLFEGIFM
jgi:hypothetical protein